jgi:hypothetical protein
MMAIVLLYVVNKEDEWEKDGPAPPPSLACSLSRSTVAI